VADADKKIIFVGTSRADIRSFPEEARVAAGHQLRKVQKRQDPDHYKPMGTVGSGVYEITINLDDAYRVFYVAKFADVIYVLHAFQKTTRKTAQSDIDLGRKRYATVVLSRKS